jgi:hypothetical protein
MLMPITSTALGDSHDTGTHHTAGTGLAPYERQVEALGRTVAAFEAESPFR